MAIIRFDAITFMASPRDHCGLRSLRQSEDAARARYALLVIKKIKIATDLFIH